MSPIRKNASFQLILHPPTSDTGKELLARNLSEVHAAAVIRQLKSLKCPTDQKQAILEDLIHTAKQRSREQP